ncbi:ABC transporter substrate-binding protein [Lysinibacter cavernae]|uniref:Osmoprotectant transport system substrate-binding protein n=1 Tax=Lysinibacter cavernae TaxID=1640652 RepID=A0A7X5R0E8_9MICO|nr:ABC transporter substrate-binding protein [Lysinibacter cavernae]NIH53202.1 osmoprotectant transport system substrate-binding protein [Lysinibacter cavernae]
MSHRFRIGTAAAVIAALALTGCSSSDPLAADGAVKGSDGSGIIVGSADFPESQLIATIYAAALRAKDIEVTEKLNIGSREVYIPAIQDGSIDLLPEYNGALLQYFDAETDAVTPDEVSEALAGKLPEGLIALPKSDAQNGDVLTVTKETAEKYNLTTIEDLVAHADELVLGGPPEWKTRINGVKGLEQVYGLTFKDFSALDAGGPLTLSALLSGQIQVADLFSTDFAISENDLVTLEDNKKLFLAENIVPLISDAKASDEVKAVLQSVSDALTTEDLIEMNGRVAALEDMGDIAADFLKEKNLD